jgi:class 3 adenylate cyclase
MEKVAPSLSTGSLVSILTLLKNFYDTEIFSVLIKEFYNSEQKVSVAAIRSSALLGNESAIPHLYKILEKGSHEQRIAAVDALAEIRAPSSVSVLYRYFNIFTENRERLQILKALTKISPRDEKVIQLHRQLVNNPQIDADLRVWAVKGLVEARDMDVIRRLAREGSAEVKREIINGIIHFTNKEAVQFIDSLPQDSTPFSPTEMGPFLAAYLIHVKRPETKFILEKSRKDGRNTIRACLDAILSYAEGFPNPLNIFKALLIFPYFDNRTEAMNGDCLEKIIACIKKDYPYLLNELSMITVAHLEALFNNVRKNFISIAGASQKHMLLMLLFANLIERYGNEVLLLDLKEYLRGGRRFSRAEILENIRMALKDAGDEEKHRLTACLPLLQQEKKAQNLQLINLLNRVDFNRLFKLRRLNRFIRLAGILNIKTVIKLLQNILEFARKEYIPFLEETSVVTLCQLYDKTTMDEAAAFFSDPDKHMPSVKGYSRGARFLPPNLYMRSLIDLLLKSGAPDSLKHLVVDSLLTMELSKIKGLHLLLLRLLIKSGLKQDLKEKLQEIICAYPDSGAFQLLMDLTTQKDVFLKNLAISTLRNISRRDKNISRELLVNRFYSLLDDPQKETRQQSLIALVSLKDDYAIEVLGDYFKGARLKEAPQVVRKLEKPLSSEVISLLLKTLVIDDEALQEALRDVLGGEVNGRYAEQIRNILLELLKFRPQALTAGTAQKSVSALTESTIVDRPKKEFIFKRENTQILTVFFIDIASYTEKSSLIDTTTLMSLIESFEGIVIPIIRGLNGTLIKTMGDGMLAVYKHPLNAIISALQIQDKIAQYDQYRMEQEKFHVRIGINTGVVIRKEGDVFGDVVNIASRMETAANPGDILITYSTYNEIKNYVNCTELGKLNIKGKQQPMTAFLVQGMKPEYSYLPQVGGIEKQPAGEAQASEALVGLKQSLYSPTFAIPEQLRFGKDLLQDVGKRFGDISTAVEEIVWDYQEEYEFKKYLQEKWNELLLIWQKRDSGVDQSVSGAAL